MQFGKHKSMVIFKEEFNELLIDLYLFLLVGLYGTLFRRNKEAAFSNYRLWESLGFVIAYAYSTALCARMKLYSVMAVLSFGAFCYIIVEIRQLRKVKLMFNLYISERSHNCSFSIRSESKKNLNANWMNHPPALDPPTINKRLKTRPTMRRTSWKKILLSLTCRICRIKREIQIYYFWLRV